MRSALGVLLSLFPATELSACKQEVYFNFQSHGRGKLISLVCCLSARILPLTNSKSIQRNHGSYIGQLIFSIIDSPRLLAGLLTDARFCGMVCGALRYNSGVRLVIEQPRYCKRGGMRSSRESQIFSLGHAELPAQFRSVSFLKDVEVKGNATSQKAHIIAVFLAVSFEFR